MTPWALCGLSEEDWLALPLGVRLRLAASCYLGWGYARHYPHVAYQSPGVPESLISTVDRGTNCSTLTVSLLTACYPRAGWDAEDYGDLQVYGDRLPARPDAPCQAAERRGVAVRASGYLVGRWHLVQGWRALGEAPSGHAFLVLGRAADLLVLEASAAHGPRTRATSIGALSREYPAGLYACALVE